MSSKEKQVKASLVRTRQVIADKFRKLNRNRILQQKELNVKYAPITDSINKLVETKRQIHAQKNNPFLDDDENNSDAMEIDDDLISFDDTKRRKIPAKNMNTNPFISNAQNVRKDNIKIEPDESQYDVVRIYSPEDHNGPNTSHRKSIKTQSSRRDELLSTARNAISINRKSKRIGEYDGNRYELNEPEYVPCQRKRRQIEYTTPENNDFDGIFVEPKNKRSRVALSAKQCVRRKATPKCSLASKFAPDFGFENNDKIIINTKRKLNKKPPCTVIE